MASERLLELLRRAYFDEWESAMNYAAFAETLEGFDGEDIAEELRADVQEEVSHAQRIAQRLNVLDEATPSSEQFSANQLFLQTPNEKTTNTMSVVNGVIEAEEDAVETYRELAQVARDEGDVVTARLAEEFLADEEEHLNDFRSFRRELSE